MSEPLEIQYVPIDSLIPYARNSRTHSDEQIAQIAASIKEFGFTNPVLIEPDGGIIAGHGRVMAARKLGLEEVPAIMLGHLTDTQRRAYVIADNKLALNAGWDDEMLRLELSDLQIEGFDLDMLGFESEELEEIAGADASGEGSDESKYTHKVDAPVYKPEGPKPPVEALYTEERASQLVEAVKAAVIPEADRGFLLAAATRHIQFDFQQIAEYYAHSSPEVQRLMEDSALVIIDFDRAIQLGYGKLSDSISEIYAEEKGGDE